MSHFVFILVFLVGAFSGASAIVAAWLYLETRSKRAEREFQRRSACAYYVGQFGGTLEEANARIYEDPYL